MFGISRYLKYLVGLNGRWVCDNGLITIPKQFRTHRNCLINCVLSTSFVHCKNSSWKKTGTTAKALTWVILLSTGAFKKALIPFNPLRCFLFTWCNNIEESLKLCIFCQLFHVAFICVCKLLASCAITGKKRWLSAIFTEKPQPPSTKLTFNSAYLKFHSNIRGVF